jgi:hypothetical protein
MYPGEFHEHSLQTQFPSTIHVTADYSDSLKEREL